ncbi:MAG: DUF3820 family protein [Comamonas sp.]|uniref:DUF3820 family protein n=1 Tax=Comamonas sp. TaxID=34028 RepID=UPI003D112514
MSTPFDPDQLLRLLTTTMPFGKYQGRAIADLPGNYLNWFAREGFPKGDLGRLLALMHEIDHNGLGELLRPLRASLQGSGQAAVQPPRQ